MEPNWAAENLQVIRTLMERSALYRRALAPVMMAAGGVGTAAAVVPCFVEIHGNRGFSLFWMAVSVLAAGVTLLLVRRQALRDSEPFWSLPARRVSEALVPSFLTGLIAGGVLGAAGETVAESSWLLAALWVVLYGCGLHAAGFFTPRGIRWFGLALVVGGCGVWVSGLVNPGLRSTELAHYVMGGFFGVGHLAYGIYLYFSEMSRGTV